MIYLWLIVAIAAFVLSFFASGVIRETLRTRRQEKEKELARMRANTVRDKAFTAPLPEYGYYLVGEDSFGKVWRLNSAEWVMMRMSVSTHADEGKIVSNRCILEVKDPSTGQVYFLSVPDLGRSPKAAVAWTFGMDADQYNPLQET